MGSQSGLGVALSETKAEPVAVPVDPPPVATKKRPKSAGRPPQDPAALASRSRSAKDIIDNRALKLVGWNADVYKVAPWPEKIPRRRCGEVGDRTSRRRCSSAKLKATPS